MKSYSRVENPEKKADRILAPVFTMTLLATLAPWRSTSRWSTKTDLRSSARLMQDIVCRYPAERLAGHLRGDAPAWLGNVGAPGHPSHHFLYLDHLIRRHFLAI